MDLTKLPKSSTNSLDFQQHFSELKTNYTNYVSIYTDGSKDGTSVTSAAIINKNTISRRLPDGTSVFSAEAKAIELALQHVKHCNIAKIIIVSDSLSCLQAIKSCQLKNPLDILELHDSLTTSEIIFGCRVMWASREILWQMLQQRLHILLLFHQCQFHIAILNMLLVLILNRYVKKNGTMKHIINYTIFNH